MSCDEWNTFIQVNIYGQTLEALSQRGVVLEAVLNDLGCSKHWITEGKLYNEQSIDSEDTIVVPVLSTTTVEEKYPRFSTPAVSQSELQRKFTLNLPMKLSEINSSFEEDGFSMEPDENDDVIVELLSELVEKAASGEPEFNPNTERPILSTTIVKKGPRYSTPIASEVDLSEVFALDMPEIFSDIESNDDDAIVTGMIDPEVQFQRKTIRSISTVPSVKRRQSKRRLSAPNLKELGPEHGEKPRLKRPSLTRSTTERKCSQLKISKFCSMNSEIGRTAETNTAQLLARIDSNRSQEKGEAAGRTFEVPEPHDEPHDSLSMPHYHEMENIVYDQSFNQYDFDEEGGDYHSIPEESEETLQIDMYTPPPLPNTIKTKSIMKSVDGQGISTIGNKKSVSFKTPPKNRDNTLHIIQCCFKGCKKGLQWRRKYGKIHLANHVLSHLKEKCIKCKNCDFRANSVTQIRYHYKTKHSDVKMEGFGVLSLQFEDVNIGAIWEKCYRKQLHIVGRITNNPLARRRTVRKNDNNAPSTSAQPVN